MTGSSAPTEPKVTACQIFVPIYWSDKDTDATIAAVKEHNAAWKALCQPPKEKP